MKDIKSRSRRTFIGLIIFSSFASAAASAAPISTNTALPVAQGEYILRQQIILNQSGDDATALDRDHRVIQSLSILGYGITPDLAMFGVLPVTDKSLKLLTPTGQRVTRKADGLGDVRAFARYTLFKKNQPGQTFRVAPFAGIELPTGENDRTDTLGLLPKSVQPGSGSWDPFGGLIITFQTLDFEIDLQASYQANTKASGFKIGDVARLDVSLQYRLWPATLSDTSNSFLYGVGEINFNHKQNNELAGVSDPNSGGTSLWGLIGLQYVTIKTITELGLQLPLVQDLNGSALEREYIARASFRYNF